MSKKLKWYKVGDPIPYDGKYIKTESKITGYEKVEVEDFPPYGGMTTYTTEKRPVYEEMALYEVGIND